ncbi:MAG: SDR family oxidoreductase [Gemmataceae bacterium]|nr:SDR family oxidoreductase [Gemmataceae bacterium]MCI0739550.1 SDR family oxidoreductase [Gemmataceae bacterium]
MYKCLVTGGAGFIGSHLVDRLLALGHPVRVLDNLSTGNPANLAHVRQRIDWHEGSVADPAAAAKAVHGCEVVFHLAAYPSVAHSVEQPMMSHEIAATGTLALLDAVRKEKIRRVVYAGSSSAYGDQPGEVRREEDALIPQSPYAAAKLAGEHYCSCFTAVYGLETVRLRFFNVFGPRQDAKSPYSGVIALFSAAMSADKTPTIFGDGLQARDFVYVENVVDALLLAAQAKNAVGKVYNVGFGGSVTLLDLVRHLNRLLGKNIQAAHAPERAGDIRFSQADISRARQDLGYDPKIPFEEGLRRTLAAAR